MLWSFLGWRIKSHVNGGLKVWFVLSSSPQRELVVHVRFIGKKNDIYLVSLMNICLVYNSLEVSGANLNFRKYVFHHVACNFVNSCYSCR